MSQVRAIQSFAGGTKHADRMVTGGEIFDENDPIVKAFPGFFERLVEVVPEPMRHKPSRPTKGGRVHG